MLDALRQTRGLSASEAVGNGAVPVSGSEQETGPASERDGRTGHIDGATHSNTQAPPPLPESVAAACETFGFGDREEVSRNFRRAAELHRLGRDPQVIIREIRQGADVRELFV